MKFTMYITQIGIFLCFLLTSNAEDHCRDKCEDAILLVISASLKSHVLLPCHFETSHNTSNKQRVRWEHFSNLLKITQDGDTVFDDPREGRVTVFPILAATGNFSIIIHDLQASDFGTYCCELNNECWRLKITELVNKKDEKNGSEHWIFFAAGAGLFVLLFIAFYLLTKFCKNCKRSSKSNSDNGVQNEGDHTRETQNTETKQRHQNNRGQNVGSPTLYENEAHAPNQTAGVTKKPKRAFRAVPQPTASQQSEPKPYYVNHSEFSISSNVGQKQKKQKHFQIRNPIYGD